MATTSGPVVQSRGPVRISLPASIAFNADALKKAITSVVEQTSCRTCFSGGDCHFAMERDLIVDKNSNVELNPQPLPPGGVDRPTPIPWHVSVAFQGRVSFNIKQVLTAVDNINNLLLCPGCHSGFDVSYLTEVIQIGVDQAGQAQLYGAALSE